MLKDKKTPKVSLSSISVGHLLLGIQPTLRVLCYPVKLFGENEISFPRGYWLEIASGLKIRGGVHFSFLFQDHIWCRSRQGLSPQSLWFIYASVTLIQRALGFQLFLLVFHTLLCIWLLELSFYAAPGFWSLERKYLLRNLFTAQCTKDSHSLHHVWLEASVFVSICFRKSLCFHLLQEESSLFMVQEGTDL